MWAAKVFFAVLAIAWADRLSAKEYQPSPEIAFFRPENPVQRISRPQTCMDAEKPPTRIQWRIEDGKGNVIEAGMVVVRRRC